MKAAFSTLAEGSLCELRASWKKIDAYQHVNNFLSLNQVKIALAQSRCDNHQLDLTTITVWYDSAFSVMRDLKGIGANHVSGRSHGLTSRETLLQVEHEYQAFKNDQGLLPASYQVCFGVIHL
jgi:malonyl-CoA O-methyltransferase